MKISVFPEYSSIAGREVFAAFIESLKKDGMDVVHSDMEADVAVIWSVLWHGRMKQNKPVWDHYRSQNKPVIVLEVGALERNETWKVGINGINRLANFGNDNVDSSRVDSLGLSLKPWQKTGSDILVCGQHQESEIWRGKESVQEWMMNVTTELKKYTDRRIILRPHPRFKVNPDFGKFNNVLVANPKPLEGTYDDFNFEEVLQNAWAVVCYNSGLSVSVVRAGVPVFVAADSLCYDVGTYINRLDKIETPAYPDRTEWLNKLSYTEWTIDEIRSGIPFSRIKGELECMV